MKTVADLKRRLTPGVVLELTAHAVPRAQPLVGLKRAIAAVRGKEIAFEPVPQTNDQQSWLTLPKADDIRIDGADAFTILAADHTQLMSYRFVLPAAATQ